MAALSKIAGSSGPQRRRVDAARSIAAILDAAIRVLNKRPESSMEEIARAAGVSRQTVYAHYRSRDALLAAVVDRIAAEGLAAMDAAQPDDGPPAEALVRLLDASWRALAAYPLLLHDSVATASVRESYNRQALVAERVERVIQRGKRAGEFDRHPSAPWLAAAVIALQRAAAQEVSANRMTSEAATSALKNSVRHVLGVPGKAR